MGTERRARARGGDLPRRRRPQRSLDATPIVAHARVMPDARVGANQQGFSPLPVAGALPSSRATSNLPISDVAVDETVAGDAIMFASYHPGVVTGINVRPE
jgi:hypothetical protein